MNARDDVWKQYVEDYDIEVPKERLENELAYFTLQERHRMQYDTLTGGGPHLFADKELSQQREALHNAAYFEAKSDLVMRALLTRLQPTVTREELELEASAMAQRQGSTVAAVKTFFGEDLAGLERDVKERKVLDWVCMQAK